ncbi:MAG: ATP-grasp domain-containing protein, partial [Promethearchaeota archaeon]
YESVSEYFGGFTPLEDYEEILYELTQILNKANFSQFSGYFGIDIIRNDESKITFIEINPRLTTSYIGLRNVIEENPARLILQSKLNHQFTTEIRPQYHSLFTRMELEHSEARENSELKEEVIFQSLREIPEFVTPPISLNDTNHYSCFISTKTKDLIASKKRVQEIVQILSRLGFTVIK